VLCVVVSCTAGVYVSDTIGPTGMQGTTMSVLLIVAWSTVIKGQHFSLIYYHSSLGFHIGCYFIDFIAHWIFGEAFGKG
jgi:hypothetical protein